MGSCAKCDGAEKPDMPVPVLDKKTMPVTDLTPDQKGRIAFIRGDCKVVQHLSDLGLTVGTTVSILKKTPLDGTVEISVRRTRLAIDHAIAENIFIEPSVAGLP